MSLSKSDLHKRVTSIIDKLPQRAAIPDGVAERWIREVIKLEGERAIWHAYRASTIGGSEAGEFPLAALRERPAYNSLESIWRQKMLLELPERPNIYMRRGTAMEPLAEAVYLTLTGHKSVLDTPAVQAAFNKPHADYPHIGGNPDQVVDAPAGPNIPDVGSYRIITDFKVRNSLDEEKGISLINGSQLHWYGLIHTANLQQKPDGYALAELDIPSDMIDDLMRNPPADWQKLAREIASINRPGFGMKIRYFQHNEGLANNLTRLTKQFWDKYVLTGTPYHAPKQELPKEMSKQDHAAIEQAQNRFLTHKLAENAANEGANKVRKELEALTAQYDLEDWPFESPGLSAGFTKRFNKDKAATSLIAAGVDRDSLCKPSDTPDVDRMVQTLKNHGLLTDAHYKPTWDTRAIKAALKEQRLSVTEFEDKSLRMALTRTKADLPVRELLEEKMGAHIEAFMNDELSPSPELDLSDEMDDDEQQHLKLA